MTAAARSAAQDSPAPGLAPEERISQPVLVGGLQLFDALNFPVSGLLAYLSAAQSLSLDGVWIVTSLVGDDADRAGRSTARYAYTIRAMGNFPRQAVSLALAFGLALALWNAAAVLAGFSEPHLLRGWTLLWFAGGWITGCGARAVFAGAVTLWTRQGRLARRTVVVGGGALRAGNHSAAGETRARAPCRSSEFSTTAIARGCRRTSAATGCSAPSTTSTPSAAMRRSTC